MHAVDDTSAQRRMWRKELFCLAPLCLQHWRDRTVFTRFSCRHGLITAYRIGVPFSFCTVATLCVWLTVRIKTALNLPRRDQLAYVFSQRGCKVTSLYISSRSLHLCQVSLTVRDNRHSRLMASFRITYRRRWRHPATNVWIKQPLTVSSYTQFPALNYTEPSFIDYVIDLAPPAWWNNVLIN